MTLEQLITAMEKEIADLKRQLGERPKKYPLSDPKNGNYNFCEKACNDTRARI